MNADHFPKHHSSLPFDTSEQLITLLEEQGEPPFAIKELLPSVHALLAVPPPLPTDVETQRLLASLTPHLPRTSVVRKALQYRESGMRGTLLHLSILARMQVSILRPSFWLLTFLISLYGILTLSFASSFERKTTFLLQAIGPLFAYLSTLNTFRSFQDRVFELELSCPSPFWQLVYARLIVVLGYDISLGLLLSVPALILGKEGFLFLTLHWLMPLLLVMGLALFLSLYLPVTLASSIAYAVWVTFLLSLSVLAQRASIPFVVLSVQGEMAFGGIGVLLAIGSFVRMRRAWPDLLNKGS